MKFEILDYLIVQFCSLKPLWERERNLWCSLRQCPERPYILHVIISSFYLNTCHLFSQNCMFLSSSSLTLILDSKKSLQSFFFLWSTELLSGIYNFCILYHTLILREIFGHHDINYDKPYKKGGFCRNKMCEWILKGC